MSGILDWIMGQTAQQPAQRQPAMTPADIQNVLKEGPMTPTVGAQADNGMFSQQNINKVLAALGSVVGQPNQQGGLLGQRQSQPMAMPQMAAAHPQMFQPQQGMANLYNSTLPYWMRRNGIS